MPMNRHMTWGDRQAETAREKNLKKLQKLAAKLGAPAAQITSAVDAPTPAVPPRAPDAEVTKPTPAAPKTARPSTKPAANAPAKKAASSKAVKRGKK
jgi:hypothetical protein